MTNTDTAPAARPTTSVLDDDALRAMIERFQAAALNVLDTFRAQVAETSDLAYTASWHVGPTVRAQAQVVIYARALAAPAPAMRAVLARQIASALKQEGGSTDTWTNAVAGETREAGRLVLSHLASELDPADLLSELA